MSTSVPQPIPAGSLTLGITSQSPAWVSSDVATNAGLGVGPELSLIRPFPPAASHLPSTEAALRHSCYWVLPFGLKLCVSMNSEPGLTSQSLLTTVPQAWVCPFLSPEPRAKYKLGMMGWMLPPVGAVMGVSPEDKLEGSWCSRG